jgi:hypothetical protein
MNKEEEAIDSQLAYLPSDSHSRSRTTSVRLFPFPGLRENYSTLSESHAPTEQQTQDPPLLQRDHPPPRQILYEELILCPTHRAILTGGYSAPALSPVLFHTCWVNTDCDHYTSDSTLSGGHFHRFETFLQISTKLAFKSLETSGARAPIISLQSPVGPNTPCNVH